MVGYAIGSINMPVFVIAATKKQFEWFISSLHGRVAKLLRHTIGASGIYYLLL